VGYCSTRHLSGVSELLPPDEEDQLAVHRLADDLPGLWHAETTTTVDRKRLLRLVITEVTLTGHSPEWRADFVILWCGGATTRHTVSCPPRGHHSQTESAMLDRIRKLAARRPDHQIAADLNAEGLRTRTVKWSYARVRSMRKQHRIPTACPLQTRDTEMRADGLVPIRVAAQRLGVSSSLDPMFAV
jgi:hypothetical protein